MKDSLRDTTDHGLAPVDLFEGTSDGVLVHDSDGGTVVDANTAARDCYEREASELRGAAPSDLVAEDVTATDLISLARQDNPVRWTVPVIDDTDRLLDVTARRVTAGDHILSFARDVTGKASRESTLESNQATLKRLQEIVSDRDLTFDEKIDSLLGLGREWLGLSVGYVTHIREERQVIESAIGDHEEIQAGESVPLSESYCQYTLEEAQSGDTVRTIQNASDEDILNSDEYERFGLSCYMGGQITVDGSAYGTVCFADTEPRERPFTEMERAFVDLITQWVGMTIEQQQEEADRNRQRSLLESVFNSQRTQVGITDTEGRVVDANEAALEFIGREPEDLAGDFVWETPWFKGERAHERCELAVERALSGEIDNFEATYESADGSEVVFSTNVRPVFNDGDVIHTVIEGHDITDLRKREERLEQLSLATNQLLYTHDKTEVATTVTAITQHIIGRPLAAMWSYDESDDTLYPIGSTAQAAAFADVEVPEELPPMTPGSREKEIFDAGEATVIEDYQSVDNPSAPGVPLRTMFCFPLSDNGMLCVGSQAVETFDESEQLLMEILASAAAAALERVSREAELQDHREELERSNQALQQFAYIASHDLQEPLRMVSSYIDLLDSEYGDELDDEAAEYMTFAVDGANRMQEMVDALLRYSRVETKAREFERTDPEDVVSKTLGALQMRIDETDTTVSTGGLPAVRADPDQLGQVFQNLLENAIEYAVEAGVEPRIEVDGANVDGMVEFRVSDNGPGIPAGTEDDIFEIFERGGTHETSGTGIGLAVCQRIIQRHDGRIWAEPSEDGATFRFTLPAVTERGT